MATAARTGDPAVALLLPQCGAATLIAADEHWADAVWPSGAATVISNRCEIAAAAAAAGLQSHFNDFDFAALQGQQFDSALLRLPKERPLCHHLINQLYAFLKPGALLWLCGAKNDGIKTGFARASERFGGAAAVASKLRKHGTLYLGAVAKGATATPPLDSQRYPELRPLPAAPQWQSKPGIFGWQKIDRGSELLLHSWQQLVNQSELTAPRRLLDLGCGYGYLGISAAQWLAGQRQPFELVLTDNNASALLACSANLQQLATAASCAVVAADAGAGIAGQFELILCNPPFHQGFSVEASLTTKFLTATEQLLQPGGAALFVVNEFIALDNAAVPLHFTEVVRRDGFKVVLMQRRR